MAGPLAGVQISANQIAQQKLQDPSQQNQGKTGASKFDGVMADKANQANGVNAAQKVGQVQKVDVAKAVEQVRQLDAAKMNKVGAPQSVAATQQVTDPAQAQKLGNSTLGHMIQGMEKGQNVMDQLIKVGMSGKQMNNGELIALQAGVFKYSQEMELTGKVVEKATSGLKDTLKTQV
jgi:hypothetical protein